MNQDNRPLSSPETTRRANITFPPVPRPPVLQAATRFAPDIPPDMVADYTRTMAAFRAFVNRMDETARNMQNISNPNAHMRQIIQLDMTMREIVAVAERVIERGNGILEEQEQANEPRTISRGM
ncbi:hypothetical protein [Nitrospira sp. BLG_2]|uniref:hypothetical protein n=1 Tax=Nitrospira sp. BLG_2 TaxID=3397507 RepID=UPI003B99E218